MRERERERWATQHCTHLRMDAEKMSCAIVVEPQVLEVMCVASLAALEGFTTHRTECLVGGGGRVFGWRPSRRRWHKGTIGHILAHIYGSDVVTCPTSLYTTTFKPKLSKLSNRFRGLTRISLSSWLCSSLHLRW